MQLDVFDYAAFPQYLQGLYHAVPNCACVSEKYWPLMSFPAGLLGTSKYHALLPCPVCNPPERPAAPSADGE